jgi:methyltransferase (TIGR00027 family)
MTNSPAAEPESSAVRVALWRALHMLVDAPPYVFEDEIGLRLADPGESWRDRPDMDPHNLSRTSIVARARIVDDLVVEQASQGLGQYVLLGAGLDSFSQRHPELSPQLTVFEVDQPGPQRWKRQRLEELGYGVPPSLRLVPVDFETDSWWERLLEAGFNPTRPAIFSSLGVSVYLTSQTNTATLRCAATLAPGSTFVMTFMLPLELTNPQERPHYERVLEAARAAGTPFLSFYSPDEVLSAAKDAGFTTVRHISSDDIIARFFTGRADGLHPSSAEEILVAAT